MDDIGQEKDFIRSGYNSALRFDTSRSKEISKFTSLNKSDTDQVDSDDPDKTEGEN